MANMSYCRFENTLADLADCLRALHRKEYNKLNSYEQKAAIELIAMCKEISDDYGSIVVDRRDEMI